MQKIGVVVTVYNLQDYVEECVNSILNQEYDNLDIVIVDDGSTDNSPEICDRIAKYDKRVKVIHQSNQGLIRARLNGANSLSTQYISFVDGDDWIKPELYKDIVESGYLDQTDIIDFGIIRYHSENDMRNDNGIFKAGLYEKNKMIKEIIPKMLWYKSSYGLDPSICSKIIKRDLFITQINNIKDLKIHFGEDAAVIYPMILKACNIAVIKKSYYFHRQRKNNVLPRYITDPYYYDKVYKLYSYLRNVFSMSQYKEQLIKQLDYFYIASVRLGKIRYGDLAFEEDYIFPFDRVQKGSNIILYGAGRVGQTFYKQLQKLDYCRVVGWIDMNAQIYDKYEIHTPEYIVKLDYDILVIAIDSIKTAENIRNSLCERGIEKDKIIVL